MGLLSEFLFVWLVLLKLLLLFSRINDILMEERKSVMHKLIFSELLTLISRKKKSSVFFSLYLNGIKKVYI